MAITWSLTSCVVCTTAFLITHPSRLNGSLQSCRFRVSMPTGKPFPALPDGGGAFPAFQDDAGPVLLRVEKPSQDRVKKAFKLDYGELYPSAVVTGFIVVSEPDKETELEPNEPEKE